MMHARTIDDNLTKLQAPLLDRKFLSCCWMMPAIPLDNFCKVCACNPRSQTASHWHRDLLCVTWQSSWSQERQKCGDIFHHKAVSLRDQTHHNTLHLDPLTFGGSNQWTYEGGRHTQRFPMAREFSLHTWPPSFQLCPLTLHRSDVCLQLCKTWHPQWFSEHDFLTNGASFQRIDLWKWESSNHHGFQSSPYWCKGTPNRVEIQRWLALVRNACAQREKGFVRQLVDDKTGAVCIWESEDDREAQHYCWLLLVWQLTTHLCCYQHHHRHHYH